MGQLQQMAQWASGQVLHLFEQSAAFLFSSLQRLQRIMCPMSLLLVPNHTGVIRSYKGSALSPCFHCLCTPEAFVAANWI